MQDVIINYPSYPRDVKSITHRKVNLEMPRDGHHYFDSSLQSVVEIDVNGRLTKAIVDLLVKFEKDIESSMKLTHETVYSSYAVIAFVVRDILEVQSGENLISLIKSFTDKFDHYFESITVTATIATEE